MNYWLFKTEPDVFGIGDLRARGDAGECWDGIRNYQARNFLRDQVCVGDQVLIYHSSCAVPAIVGEARVSRAAYPDPWQFDPEAPYYDPKSSPQQPRWFAVDVVFQRQWPQPLSLAQIKADSGLADMVLVKSGRLSVQPVSAKDWQALQRYSVAAMER